MAAETTTEKRCPSAKPHVVGGFGEEHPANKAVEDACHAVKTDFQKKSGENVAMFHPVSYKSQVVSGTNYLIKVDCGSGSYAHIKVHVPLPHAKEQHPTLLSFKLHKKEEDPLVPFEQPVLDV
ncbi:cystatin-A2-like [Hyperolius riggenbachi]|uniref:cystatin-A2-like n=1 Tax=Hyperolius riggenbachi TaxID=752182 RepID=UPI0035A2FD90